MNSSPLPPQFWLSLQLFPELDLVPNIRGLKHSSPKNLSNMRSQQYVEGRSLRNGRPDLEKIFFCYNQAFCQNKTVSSPKSSGIENSNCSFCLGYYGPTLSAKIHVVN